MGAVTARRWSLLAVAAAVLTGVAVAFGPMVATSGCSALSTGTVRCASGTTSLFADQGAGILGIVAIPVVVTLVPLLLPSRWTVTGAAVLLSVAAFIGSASVGIFLIPTVILAWLAVRATNHEGRAAPA
jgi:hypothetical protein